MLFCIKFPRYNSAWAVGSLTFAHWHMEIPIDLSGFQITPSVGKRIRAGTKVVQMALNTHSLEQIQPIPVNLHWTQQVACPKNEKSKHSWSFEINTYETFFISELYGKNLIADSVWWDKKPNGITLGQFRRLLACLATEKYPKPLFLLKYSYSD